MADAARQLLKETVQRVLGARADGMDISTEVLQGHASLRLVELSRDAAMIVVGSRGRGGFAGLLLGSVGQHVAEHGQCPVVVVHGDPGER